MRLQLGGDRLNDIWQFSPPRPSLYHIFLPFLISIFYRFPLISVFIAALNNERGESEEYRKKERNGARKTERQQGRNGESKQRRKEGEGERVKRATSIPAPYTPPPLSIFHTSSPSIPPLSFLTPIFFYISPPPFPLTAFSPFSPFFFSFSLHLPL